MESTTSVPAGPETSTGEGGRSLDSDRPRLVREFSWGQGVRMGQKEEGTSYEGGGVKGAEDGIEGTCTGLALVLFPGYHSLVSLV